MQLDDVIEAIEDAIKRIDEDERFLYEPASVRSNPFLALIQTDFRAQMKAYKQVLFILQKLKESEAKIIKLNNVDVTDNVILIWDRTASFIEEIQLSNERITLDSKKHYKVYIVEEDTDDE